MTDLIKKLEALEAPCREIDGEIAVVFFGGEIRWRQQNYTMEPLPVHVYPSKNHLCGTAKEHVPDYTASISAALTLPSKGRTVINIAEDGVTTAIADGTEGTAFNAATALCIAALRAQETSNAGR